MAHGAILLPVSIAERPLAVPADIPRPIMEITATPPVRGVNIPIRSIVARKPAPAAARRPMTMLTTAILMVHGPERMIRSISARKPARFVRLPVKNTQTMWTQTAMESATIAVRPFR